jgi:pimeloyl-ACP methyl ester carboxylesterase
MSVPLPFTYKGIPVNGVHINCAVTGEGPPVLLLHGYPQTHLIWHHVAPRLASTHSVVLADLRGYGDSSKPAAGPDHAEYSKRAMAADQVGVMRELGFSRFAVVGHDRGGTAELPQSAAVMAAPGFAAFLHRDGGDDHGSDRVGPGPAEQAVEQQADEQHT